MMNKYFFFIIFGLSVSYCSTNAAQNTNGFFSKVNAGLRDPKKWIEEHLEFASLFRCILNAPEVLTLDSENVLVIKVTSLLAAFGTGSKLSYELFKTRKTTAASLLFYALPKMGLYSLSELYDVIRSIDAEYVAEKNKKLNKEYKIRNLKISQCLQLLTEMSIRICSFGATFTDGRRPGEKDLAFYLSEIADAVELWRLLSRWWTVLRFKIKVDMSIESDDSKQEDVESMIPSRF